MPSTARFNFTVTALDPFGNTVTSFVGTVSFTSSDPQALLPLNATLTGGTGIFSATLKTPGKQTVTATDNARVRCPLPASAVILAVNSSGIAPFVESIDRTTPAGLGTNASSSVIFTVTFSQAVIGVNLGDFALALTGTVAATLSKVTPVSGAVYTVTLSGITGFGNIGLNLVDNGSIYNLAGNPLNDPNGSAVFTFAAPQTFVPTGYKPSSLVVEDVNGDGNPDIVVANYFSNTVSVLLGNGNGDLPATADLRHWRCANFCGGRRHDR